MLPWSAFWDRNYFVASWPGLRAIVTNNFVRGAVSGLGVVNLLAGFADLALIFMTRERHDVSVVRSRNGPGTEDGGAPS